MKKWPRPWMVGDLFYLSLSILTPLLLIRNHASTSRKSAWTCFTHKYCECRSLQRWPQVCYTVVLSWLFYGYTYLEWISWAMTLWQCYSKCSALKLSWRKVLLCSLLVFIIILQDFTQDFHVDPTDLHLSGLEAFTFDYIVKWPVSLVLNRKVKSLLHLISNQEYPNSVPHPISNAVPSPLLLQTCWTTAMQVGWPS